MQPAVRKALTNLQGIYDEGFMTQQEYDKRRKAIIDGATALPVGQATKAATKPPAAAKKSVFDRLGADANAGVDSDQWGHDGFQQLYGNAGKSAKGQKQGRTVVVTKAPKGDLRNKLSGAIRKPGKGRGKALPEKCPW